MRKYIYNTKGLTLIEILATVTILSIISIFIGSILISSNKNHAQQVTANQQLADVSYVLKVVTKDIRKSTKWDGEPTNFSLISSVLGEEQDYLFADNSIYRNNVLLATNIKEFSVDSSLNIVIISGSGHETITQLHFRGGSQ